MSLASVHSGRVTGTMQEERAETSEMGSRGTESALSTAPESFLAEDVAKLSIDVESLAKQTIGAPFGVGVQGPFDRHSAASLFGETGLYCGIAQASHVEVGRFCQCIRHVPEETRRGDSEAPSMRTSSGR